MGSSVIERWQEIPGFTRYEASTLGRVRNKSGKVLKTPPKSNGYLQVTLCRTGGGDYVNWSVHRLIAHTFLKPVEGRELVLHRNGDRADNRLENLYRGDFQDNHQDAERHKTFVRGSKNGRAKLNEEDVHTIRFELLRGTKQADLAREYGVSRSLINRIHRGKCWRHVQ